MKDKHISIKKQSKTKKIMKKLVLLLSLAVFAATGVFAQTTAPSDACNVNPNNAVPTPSPAGSFTISIAGPASGQPLAFASAANNDEGICGLTVKEYIGGVEVSCYGKTDGEITVNITGGYAPYRYKIFKLDSAATGYINLSGLDAITSNLSHTFSGLGGDASYYVTVESTSDGSSTNFSCLISTLPATPGTCQGAVYLDAPNKIVANYCQKPDYCQANAAEVTLNIAGGVQYYTVAWTATTAMPVTGTGPSSAAPGTASPDADTGTLGAQLGTDHTTSMNPTSGSLTNVVEGNSDDGNTTQTAPQQVTISGLTGNYNYQFTITDANGCVVQ